MLERAECASGRTALDLGATPDWQGGAIKLLLNADLLRLRQKHQELFENGSYESVGVVGPAATRVCAFLRRHNGSALLVAVLLHPLRGMEGVAETKITLPDGVEDFRWSSPLDAREPQISNREIPADQLFRDIPTAVLVASP